MTTERITEFLVLSQTLNYSKAAARLFITEATLSRHISSMEEELGIQLLERDTHSVRLTAAGRMFLKRSRLLLRNTNLAVSRLRTSNISTSGSLKIACLEAVVFDRIQAFLNSFAKKFPSVEINVDVLGLPETMKVFNEYDIFFSPFEFPDLPSSFSSQVAFSSPCVLAVKSGHRLSDNHSVELGQLVGEDLVVPYPYELFSSFAANRQLAEVRTGRRLNIKRAANIDSALMMIFLGQGVSILPQNLGGSAPSGILQIDIVPPECHFDTIFYYREELDDPTARLFIDELTACG